MSSRDDILASIRANLPRVDRPLPYVPAFDDDPPASLLDAFKASLLRMGGMFLDPPAAGDILAPVRAKIAGAKIVCSMVPEITSNRDIADLGALRDLRMWTSPSCARLSTRRSISPSVSNRFSRAASICAVAPVCQAGELLPVCRARAP